MTLQTNPRRTGASLAEWLGLLAVAALLAYGVQVRGVKALDEGFVLSSADLVARGLVPNRDFVSPYGPLNPHVVATAFALFGEALVVERLVGALYAFVIGASVFALLRRQSRAHAWVGGVLALMLVFSRGGLAFAYWGGYACLAAALALSGTPERGRARQLAIGLFAGLATGFRPDFSVAGAAVIGCALFAVPPRLPLLAGAACGALPLLWHLARIGPVAALHGLVVEPSLWARSRVLPLPPDKVEVTIAMVALLASIALLLHAGVRASRARADTGALAIALVALCTLPHFIQRADREHLAFAASLPIPLALGSMPAPTHRRAVARFVLASLVAWGSLAAVSLSPLGDLLVAIGRAPARAGVVRSETRAVPLEPPARAAAYTRILATLRRVAQPNQTLFVGPQDLRRLLFNDVFVYWLVPELRPASRLVVLNPTLDPEVWTSLADDLARADFLLLTSAYHAWPEPNASRAFGPDTLSRLVQARFCVVEEIEDLRLLRRCDASASRTSR